MLCGTLPEISRWWKRLQRRDNEVLDLSEKVNADPDSGVEDGQRAVGIRYARSTNPRTLLLGVTRTEEGLDFICGRVEALRGQLRSIGDDPKARFLLALYLEKLGDAHLEEALREMDQALTRMRRKEGGAMSERARLAKACRALKARKRALACARETGILSKSRPFAGGDNSGAPPGKRQKRSLQGEGQTVDGLRTVSGAGPSLKSPRFHPIDKRDASKLAYEEFIEKYALPGRPVILKGGLSQCFEPGRAWSRDFFSREAGHKMVTVRRWVPGSVSWARLEEAGQERLSRLLDDAPQSSDNGFPTTGSGMEPQAVHKTNESVLLGGQGAGEKELKASGCFGSGGGVSIDGDRGQKAEMTVRRDGDVRRRQDPLYLHDWSVPQNLDPECPLLMGSFRVPKFFAGDMLQRVAGRGLPYTDRNVSCWPSLFVGPKGSKSDTHIDSFGSHFWMGLLEGRKRWLLYPKDAAPLLYPIWSEGCHDPVFEAGLDAPDPNRHPAALLARGFECILEAGDVLFVPAGCPHRVENLTDTLAVSCNYVDATNVVGALEALDEQALTDPGSGALVSALRDCKPSLVREQRGVPWGLLKTWPRDGEVADWVLPGAFVS